MRSLTLPFAVVALVASGVSTGACSTDAPNADAPDPALSEGGSAQPGGDDGNDDRGGAGTDEPASDGGSPATDGGTSGLMSPVNRAFADPFVLHAGGAYHLYATNGRGKNIPHIGSADLSSWNLAAETDAMPTLPSWAAAEGIMEVRESAGTGLIKEARSNAWGGIGRTRPGLPTPAHRLHRHFPAV